MLQITFLDVFIILIVIVIITFYVKEKFTEVSYIKSDVDDNVYLVKNRGDAKEAADKIAKINSKLTTFVQHMVSKYPDNPDILRLYKNYNPDNVSEGLPSTGYTSYTINKGERLVLCVRQKDTGEFVDDNVLMYTSLHEVVHISITDIGHTDKFWKTFKWFLQEAIDIGVYTKVDYSKHPAPFCGIMLTSSVI